MKKRRSLVLIVPAFLAALILNLLPASACGQNTVFTYQGRVMVGGTDFTGTGQFEFALVTSTNSNHQATGVANMGGLAPNQFVSSCSVISTGNGYSSAPVVSFSGGGGSGATAQANLSGGTVMSITVLTPGSGYSSAPTMTIAPPPPNITYVSYWSNDGTSINGSEPGNAVNVAVTNGLFTVVLGDTTLANMAPIPASLFAQPNLQLRIWFNDGTHGFSALNPAQPLTPAPYAIGVQGPVSASQLTGTVPASQLAGAYPDPVIFSNGSNNFTGAFNGNGSGLTNISGSSLVLVSTNTSVTSWGLNANGQRDVPTNAQNVIAISAGEYHTLALVAGGTVVGWGAGETNNPSDDVDFGQSIAPPGLSNVVAVSAGGAHSMVLLENGSVYAWGNNTYGQTNVPPGLNALAISAGALHSLALTTSGTVMAWGAGESNVDSSPNWGQSIVPPGLNNVIAVGAGFAFSAALKNDGTVVVWGGDEYDVTNIPPGLNNVTAIAAGGVHMLALKSNGTVVAWGVGETNNPGDGLDFGQSIVPAGLSNVVAIAAGLFNSVALKSDGTVVAWGDNTYGESSPPPGLNNVLAIGAGSAAEHVLAIRKQSDAPVAWLNSDNTFNGNITVNGDTTVFGAMNASDLRLDDGNLWLRGGIDQNNGLGWYSAGTKPFGGSFISGPDGPVLFGESGGALGTVGTNGQQVALVWDSSGHVGLGTTVPTARLDLGSDPVNDKLQLFDGSYTRSLGANGNQLMFNLGGDGGSRFSFMDAPGGHELVSIENIGSGIGQVGIGTTFPGGTLDVRGTIKLGSSGQYYAPGGQENLRIIRGVVTGAGGIIVGSGFTVAHVTGSGTYTVTFSTPFSAAPAVTVSADSGGATPLVATTDGAAANYVGVKLFYSVTGSANDGAFHFIAIGPQ